MTVSVIVYDETTGGILSLRYEPNHDYIPSGNELIAPEGTDLRRVWTKRVDVGADPPELVPDPNTEWQRPGVVDADTREIIAEKFRDAGADAIAALDSSDAAAFMDATIRMQYLTYVALTGDRIETVEDRFF